jgi:hypothetical protein
MLEKQFIGFYTKLAWGFENQFIGQSLGLWFIQVGFGP